MNFTTAEPFAHTHHASMFCRQANSAKQAASKKSLAKQAAAKQKTTAAKVAMGTYTPGIAHLWASARIKDFDTLNPQRTSLH